MWISLETHRSPFSTPRSQSNGTTFSFPSTFRTCLYYHMVPHGQVIFKGIRTLSLSCMYSPFHIIQYSRDRKYYYLFITPTEEMMLTVQSSFQSLEK